MIDFLPSSHCGPTLGRLVAKHVGTMIGQHPHLILILAGFATNHWGGCLRWARDLEYGCFSKGFRGSFGGMWQMWGIRYGTHFILPIWIATLYCQAFFSYRLCEPQSESVYLQHEMESLHPRLTAKKYFAVDGLYEHSFLKHCWNQTIVLWSLSIIQTVSAGMFTGQSFFDCFRKNNHHDPIILLTRCQDLLVSRLNQKGKLGRQMVDPSRFSVPNSWEQS